MAKGQKRGNRETKKPKSAGKTVNPATAAAPSFLKPGPIGSAPTSGPGFRSGKR